MKLSRFFLKTVLKLVFLFLLIALVMTLYSSWNLRKRLTEEFRSKGLAISNSIAGSAVETVLSRDSSSVQALIDQYVEISGVGYVFVVDQDARIIAHTFVPTIPKEVLPLRTVSKTVMIKDLDIGGSTFTDVSVPMLAGVSGAVHVGMDQELIQSYIKSATVGQIYLIGIIFLITVIAAYFLTRSILLPVQNAAIIAKGVAEGDLTARLQHQASDELGQLLDSIGEMTARLNSMAGKVQKSGIQLSGIADRIATNSADLDAAARQFRGFTNETVASTTQISATSLDLANTMKDVSELAYNVSLLATSGKEGLIQMETSMDHLVELTSQMSQTLNDMEQRTSNIGIVITTMTKVADRTNLLSLNAAIEAQKAGSAGSGFGVVASEIRRLADQTAVSTLEFEELIHSIQTSTAKGVSAVSRFSQEVRKGTEDIQRVTSQLAQVIEKVQALSSRFQIVSEATESQAEGAQNIRDSMIRVSDAAEKTARSVQDFVEISAQLRDAASILEQEVSHFKVSEPHP